MEVLRSMKKQMFRKLIKEKIEKITFQKLVTLKKSHSKVEKIEHNRLVMQKYLQPNKTKISTEEAQLIFKIRCRATNVKENLKGKYELFECRA